MERKKRNLRPELLALITGAVALVLLVGVSPLSRAATSDFSQSQNESSTEEDVVIAPRVVTTMYSVINKKTLNANYTNFDQQLGSCTQGKGTGDCAIQVTISSTRTVGLSLGVPRSTITAGLNISNATSVSNSTSCTSGTLKTGQSWKAYPKGTRYSYQIQKLTFAGGQMNRKETSGTLYAFDPSPNDIFCAL